MAKYFEIWNDKEINFKIDEDFNYNRIVDIKLDILLNTIKEIQKRIELLERNQYENKNG